MTELKRVLYVEDDPDIRAVARIALEVVGNFEVAVFATGEEALEQAEAFAPDLFLLDVMLPGMDGDETLIELRKQPKLADIPAMFMTAKIQPEELAKLKSSGALGVISKPFDAMTLATQMRAIWQQHQSDV